MNIYQKIRIAKLQIDISKNKHFIELLQNNYCFPISDIDFKFHLSTKVTNLINSVEIGQQSTNDVLCRYITPFSIAKFESEILEISKVDRFIGIFLISPDFQFDDPFGVSFLNVHECICYHGSIQCQKMRGKYEYRSDLGAIYAGTVFIVKVDANEREARISTKDKTIDRVTYEIKRDEQFILALRLCNEESKVRVTRLY